MFHLASTTTSILLEPPNNGRQHQRFFDRTWDQRLTTSIYRIWGVVDWRWCVKGFRINIVLTSHMETLATNYHPLPRTWLAQNCHHPLSLLKTFFSRLVSKYLADMTADEATKQNNLKSPQHSSLTNYYTTDNYILIQRWICGHDDPSTSPWWLINQPQRWCMWWPLVTIN